MTRFRLVRGDIDGFFGLFIDNLLQLMLIYGLCQAVCGMDAGFVTGTILPGAAISILLGNVFYAWQAWRLMKREGRDDVTALPYGINTPSLVAFILLIMGPVYREHAGDGSDPERAAAAARLAWQAGLFACFGSGVLETLGAFVGDRLRRVTPRAALLAPLAGIAMTFIAMGFILQLFASPAIAVVPMLLIVFTYAGRLRLPFGVPGGLLAVVLGVSLAWLFRAIGYDAWTPPPQTTALGFHPPRPVPADVFALLATPDAWRYLSVIVVMGLINVIGSLQNLESAEAAGDRFETRPTLAVNGVGSMLAACLGSAFPTTIYIGHPGWKAMGARAWYSLIDGVVVAVLCLVGAMTWIVQVVPLEATLGILMWIAIVITAQAFNEAPARHALAVAFGLIPAIGAWAWLLIDTTLRVAGTTLHDTIDALAASGVYVRGALALNEGFLVSSMIFAAMVAEVVDRRFLVAATWAAAAAGLSLTGLLHGYEITGTGVSSRFFDLTGPSAVFAGAYALAACLLILLDRFAARAPAPEA